MARKPKQPSVQKRKATVRIPAEVARRIRAGHPWIFADALRGRTLSDPPGRVLDVVDPDGAFVARAVVDDGENLVLRVLSHRCGDALDLAYLSHVVQRCLQRRQKMLDLSPTACFRLINGDSEGIPGVTVDCYGAYMVCCAYSSVAQTFQDDLVRALVQTRLPRAIYLQRRYQPPGPGEPRPGAELLWGEPAPPEVVVTEGRARYVVDVTAPGSPGLYPDMRLGRAAVAHLAAGRRVLNCFSYTGAFSVVAALYGASAVVSVDASARAHARARRNFSENSVDPGNRTYEFITGDTFATLAKFTGRGRLFDLVILDPPTFSSNKGRTFTAMRDYASLVAAAMEVTVEGGFLCAASNAAKLTAADLDRAIGLGAHQAQRRALITGRLDQPADYPVLPAFVEGAYLKFFIAMVE